MIAQMPLEFKSQISDFDWLKSDRAKALPSSSSEKIKIRNYSPIGGAITHVGNVCGKNEANV